MKDIYVYNTDRYGNNGEFTTTFEGFRDMIVECFPECTSSFHEGYDGIEDDDGQVAFLATPENLKDYEVDENGQFKYIIDHEGFFKTLILFKIVDGLIKTDIVKGATALSEWVEEGDLDGMTPADIAEEWDNLPEAE